MKSKEEFTSIISRDFWSHIHKNTAVPVNTAESRYIFCEQLHDSIINRTYSPQIPREFLVSNKHNLVARIVPVFTIADICVYYYCIKVMEEYLAINRVDCTFGGFSLGGAIRAKEGELFDEINVIPYAFSEHSFNRFGWITAWGDFTKKAYKMYLDESMEYFIGFDIANFYDTINLLHLEKKIRNEITNKNLFPEIDLLFYFLRYWNKRFVDYSPQTVGIPQDEVGDCSRILANFYLQEYDREMFEYCKENNSRYLRYADDMMIYSPDRETAQKILFFASKALKKICLNINSSKVKEFCTRQEYEHYWAFEIFALLEDKEDRANVEAAIDKYFKWKLNKIEFKDTSVLKRILSCNIEKIDLGVKASILAEVLTDDFLMNADEWILLKIYKMLQNETAKQEFISKLESLSPKVNFNVFHYRLLNFAEKNKISISNLKSIILRIKELAF